MQARIAVCAAILFAAHACELHKLPGVKSYTTFHKAADPTKTRIDADLLIPGRGDPIKNATIVFDTKILYVGSRLPPDETPTFTLPVVMPGMWDTHTHFSGYSCHEAWGKIQKTQPVFGDIGQGWYPRNYENFACALKDMKDVLDAGVTSVRELGGTYGQPLNHIEQSGLFPGPHFHYASRAIGMTGGHSDLQMMDLTAEQAPQYETFGAFCDGPAECIKRTREQIRAQADVIKIMTTGGVLSAFDQPTDEELSADEILAVTQEAARSRRVVAAHAHGLGGILSAANNGVFTLEHGSYMDEAAARVVKDKGMQYHPTCVITQTFNQTVKPAIYDDDQWAKGQALLKAHRAAVQFAISANITIATGTDCPAGDCTQAGTEAYLLHTLYGMTPLQAIEAATANGPSSLGKLGMAPQTGQLLTGYDADIIGLVSSPINDMAVLRDSRDTVSHVWKMGQIHKGA